MDKQIVVRCSRHQYGIIEKVALETELTKSELVRQLINQFGERLDSLALWSDNDDPETDDE